MDRLFVPLNKGPFTNFKENGKRFELRGHGRQYTEKFAYRGRKVELRKGYSGESLWGVIGNVVIGNLSEILEKINYKQIIPLAGSKDEAIKIIKNIMKEKDKYMAFEVILRKV